MNKFKTSSKHIFLVFQCCLYLIILYDILYKFTANMDFIKKENRINKITNKSYRFPFLQ